MTNTRSYKGYQIVKQFVGECGWNVVNPEGRCIHTGFSSLSAAKEYINYKIEIADLSDVAI